MSEHDKPRYEVVGREIYARCYEVWEIGGKRPLASNMDKSTADLLCAALNAGLTAEAIEGAEMEIWTEEPDGTAVYDDEAHALRLNKNDPTRIRRHLIVPLEGK